MLDCLGCSSAMVLHGICLIILPGAVFTRQQFTLDEFAG